MPPRLLARRSASLERDTVSLACGGDAPLTVERVRDPRARRLRLTVGLRGVRLTVPPRTSNATAERFLQDHRDWLIDAIGRRGESPGPLRPDATTHVPLRGGQVPISWRPGRFVHIALGDDGLSIVVPDVPVAAGLARALRDFYEAQARADVARWLPRYLDGLPRAPSRLRLRMMSTLWGSMTRDGALTLDLALVLGAPAAFEYVLVHELCHLIHMDHSRAFWREVEARCPDWRAQRAYFRGDGQALKPTLHALCGAG